MTLNKNKNVKLAEWESRTESKFGPERTRFISVNKG